MSFVSQVLSCAGQLEAKEIQGKMEVLSKKMEDLKLEVYEVTKGKYVDFFPQRLQTTLSLKENVDKVTEDLHEAKEKIENEVKNQLTLSKDVLTTLKGDLENHRCVLVILERLVQIQDNLESSASANKRQSYSEAASFLLKVDQLLGTPLEGYEGIQILQALQTESCVQKEKLIYEVTEKWKSLVTWNSSDDKSRQVFQLELTSGGSVLSELIGAMETLGVLESTLKTFGNRLNSYLFKPCIVNSTAVVKNSPPNIVMVTVNNEKNPVPPSPKQMYMNIMTIIQALDKYFMDLTVQDGTNFLSCLGKNVSRELLDLIVKECLTPAIPHNNKDMSAFEADCVEPTKCFQETLVNMKFIPGDDNALEDFVKNIDVLFVNKKSQDILVRARELMKSELHNTVRVSDEHPLGEMADKEAPSGKKSRKVELASSCQLSTDTLKLPACQISVCTQQLMMLAYETLEEATQSSQECAVQLFFAVRNMFELFCSVYPTAHQKALALFPQMTAVFNNDCMYVAHHLATIGHQFNKSLPQDVQATFVDLIPKIRRLGTDTMLKQLNSQKDIMMEYLKAAKGFVSVSEGSNSASTEKAVKQVLHQLGHLQKVWQEILPVSHYRRSIGTLLNNVVVEICDRVVRLEDISASDATQMASLMSLIQKRAGPLMKSASDDGDVNVTIELQRNVPKWLRFTEIITLLNASLLEINDRWADGKGPLANELTASEVKQMIRALFQNTDRRSAILAKIR
ncbi:centromere/kinetochore protein zw10 homolog isoform X2 [Saccostrea echinata]|uniref:centromere/kinetochore protein zw10 homolog isoform X2 n=1 Tax=Saccostrea echinata TaxID=191078 RepID=UPI002A7FA8A9|nr:centromere/kinetochore protein zw10 homolog isoform X2 [Saccostrea echinata]